MNVATRARTTAHLTRFEAGAGGESEAHETVSATQQPARARDQVRRMSSASDSVDPADGAGEYDPAVLEAVHQVEVATEWIERGFGALLDAHHEVGHAQGLLLEAADALDQCGQPELATRARTVIAPLDATSERWTYQVVDEFRTHLLGPARSFDEEVRHRLVAGVRHRFEALQKRRTEGSTSTTRVRTAPRDDG